MGTEPAQGPPLKPSLLSRRIASASEHNDSRSLSVLARLQHYQQQHDDDDRGRGRGYFGARDEAGDEDDEEDERGRSHAPRPRLAQSTSTHAEVDARLLDSRLQLARSLTADRQLGPSRAVSHAPRVASPRYESRDRARLPSVPREARTRRRFSHDDSHSHRLLVRAHSQRESSSSSSSESSESEASGDEDEDRGRGRDDARPRKSPRLEHPRTATAATTGRRNSRGHYTYISPVPSSTLSPSASALSASFAHVGVTSPSATISARTPQQQHYTARALKPMLGPIATDDDLAQISPLTPANLGMYNPFSSAAPSQRALSAAAAQSVTTATAQGGPATSAMPSPSSSTATAGAAVAAALSTRPGSRGSSSEALASSYFGAGTAMTPRTRPSTPSSSKSGTASPRPISTPS